MLDAYKMVSADECLCQSFQKQCTMAQKAELWETMLTLRNYGIHAIEKL